MRIQIQHLAGKLFGGRKSKQTRAIATIEVDDQDGLALLATVRVPGLLLVADKEGKATVEAEREKAKAKAASERKAAEQAEAKRLKDLAAKEAAAKETAAQATQPPMSDLLKIDGIGPATVARLAVLGITTQDILEKALANPELRKQLLANPDLKASEKDLDHWARQLGDEG